MNQFRTKALFFLFAAAVFPACNRKAATDGPRDIVVILLDAVRPDHLSAYGYKRPTTPVLDSIAREGLVYERAYSSAPWTLASVSTIFAATMPETHGAGVWSEDRTTGVPTALADSNITIAERLKEAGYKSFCRAGNPYISLGCTQGFDKSETLPGSADEIVDWGLESIREAGEQPAFLYLHFMDAHTTRDLPIEFANKFPSPEAGPRGPEHQAFDDWISKRFTGDDLDRYRTHRLGVYDGAIHYIDRAIGKLMKGLESRGRLDRTIFVILADHGEEFWDHVQDEEQNYHDSRGYFGVGHGHTMYEELLRVPFIIKGPGIKPGTRIKTPVSLLDVTPTLLEMIGMPLRPNAAIPGRALTTTFQGAEPQRIPLFAQQILYGHRRREILDVDDWKYIRSYDSREKHLLFDLKADPLEKDNKYSTEPARVAAMEEKLTRYFESLPKAGSFDPSSIDSATLKQLQNVGYLKGAESKPK